MPLTPGTHVPGMIYTKYTGYFYFLFSCNPMWRILLFCCFVSVLHLPPRSLRASSMPQVCLKYASTMRCWLIFFLFVFSSSPFLFRFGHCFRPVFSLWVLCCLLGFGFCCDSFCILYIIHICVSWYVRTYADLTFCFVLEVYDLFQLLCVLSSVLFVFLLRF